jgi:hypothetical protein
MRVTRQEVAEHGGAGNDDEDHAGQAGGLEKGEPESRPN